MAGKIIYIILNHSACLMFLFFKVTKCLNKKKVFFFFLKIDLEEADKTSHLLVNKKAKPTHKCVGGFSEHTAH